MRVAYRERLEAFSQKQQVLAGLARSIMEDASDALLNANLEKAESLVTRIDEVRALHLQGEDDAFSTLALEAPVARDLRQVLAGIHIVEDLVRMASLGIHVAKVARRRHPECAVPEPVKPHIAEMAKLACHAAATVETILATADADSALELQNDDDAVDELHHEIFQMTTIRQWDHSVREAVDVTLLSRYLERFSDHAVSVGERIVFLATGMNPADYKDSLQLDDDSGIYDEIYAKYSRRSHSHVDPED